MNDGGIVLPWPPAVLGANARVHWAVRAKAVKKYRAQCCAIVKSCGIVAADLMKDGKLQIDLEFIATDRRRRDCDNLVYAFKGGQDGVADALGIDDSKFIIKFRLSEDTTRGGCVVLTLG